MRLGRHYICWYRGNHWIDFVQYRHLRVLEIRDNEFPVISLTFHMVDPIWRPEYIKFLTFSSKLVTRVRRDLTSWILFIHNSIWRNLNSKEWKYFTYTGRMFSSRIFLWMPHVAHVTRDFLKHTGLLDSKFSYVLPGWLSLLWTALYHKYSLATWGPSSSIRNIEKFRNIFIKS